MQKIILASVLSFASLAFAKTDIAGCTSSTAGNSIIYYVPGTGEICEFLDCGGGRAPPKTTVPGCAAYSGTLSYQPSFLPNFGSASASASGVASSVVASASSAVSSALSQASSVVSSAASAASSVVSSVASQTSRTTTTTASSTSTPAAGNNTATVTTAPTSNLTATNRTATATSATAATQTGEAARLALQGGSIMFGLAGIMVYLL